MDYSFIKLEDSLDKAKQIKISPMSSIKSNEVIQLLPNEYYLQISNNSNGISFAGDYDVFLIDCNENVLADITAKVAIYEFTDNNGINQIAFELYKLNLDFGKRPIRLKFVHTTGSDIYYSNSFCLTAIDAHKTTRFAYKHRKEYYGICYDVVDFYQSIRLVTWYAQLIDETEVGNYYQISKGNTISNRPLRKQAEQYKCELMNDFVFERANIMLLHDIVYIDGVRMTNKTTFKSGEFIGDTNIYRSEVNVYKDYTQTYTDTTYIYEPLQIIDKYPQELPFVYTQSSFSDQVYLIFNKPFTLNTGTITIKDSLGSVVEVGNENDFVVTPSIGELLFPFASPINTKDTYTIEVTEGLVSYDLDINPFLTWDFEIISGEYDNTEYELSEFLTN